MDLIGRFIVLLTSLAFFDGAGPATIVSPGDSVVDGSQIKPYTTEWKVTTTTPTGTVADGGIWRDRVRLVDFNGRRALLREQVVDAPPPRTSEITSVWVDAKTLVPLVSLTVSADGSSVRNEFAGASFVVKNAGPETGFSTVEHKVTLERPVFDFYGGIFGLLLRALPLSVGRTFELPVFNESDTAPYIDTISAAVTREETIPAGYLGSVGTKVVELDAIRGIHYTFWISSEAPYIIKLQLKGPRGGLITWTLPESRPLS